MKKIILYIITLIWFFSCGNDTNNTVEGTSKVFDKRELRRNLIEKVEQPFTINLVKNCKDLQSKINDFAINETEENLTILQNTWKKVANEYAKNEVLNIGDIKKSLIHNAFYSWEVNDDFVEKYIKSSEEISVTKINEIQANARGFAAIEYLIFDNSKDKTLLFFKEPRRVQFLKVLGENLVNKAEKLAKKWKEYRPIFINNDKKGIEGGVNIIVNQMNGLLEDVKKYKIGEPAAIEKGGDPNALLLQAEKSSHSLELIKYNIQGIKAVYFGDTMGLDDYVLFIAKNDKLNKKIQSQFKLIETNIANLTSLKEDIYSNRGKVEALYTSIKGLIRLIKADVVSALSLTITFTDNDGD